MEKVILVSKDPIIPRVEYVAFYSMRDIEDDELLEIFETYDIKNQQELIEKIKYDTINGYGFPKYKDYVMKIYRDCDA
jgi:hypothetical protein